MRISSLGWSFTEALPSSQLFPHSGHPDDRSLQGPCHSAIHLLPPCLGNTEEFGLSTLDSSPTLFIPPPFPVFQGGQEADPGRFTEPPWDQRSAGCYLLASQLFDFQELHQLVAKYSHC